MENKIRIINSGEKDLSMWKFNENKDKAALLSYETFELLQFETTPDSDFIPHDNFPNCCEYHKELLDEGVKLYSQFPNCCEVHKGLLNTNWFNKDDYKYIVQKIPLTVAYTIHYFEKHVNDQNWLKLSIDYIEYTIRSFGQFPAGYGDQLGVKNYLMRIVIYLETENQIISKNKRDLLLRYLTEETKKAVVTANETPNLNVLMSIYSKWLKEFPFEISFLSHLKPYFENRNPFLKGEIVVNDFNNTAKAQLIKEDEFINWLLDTTNTILTEFNTLNLHNKGLISDYNKIQLELLLEDRKQKLIRGYQNESKDPKTRHRKILKNWLKDEKEFMSSLSALFTKKNIEKKPEDELKNTLKKHNFFELPKVKLLLDEHQEKLYQKINSEPLPYKIAMFDYLDFLNHLQSNYFTSKYKLNKELSKWFKSDNEGRTIKGHINSLNSFSNEDKNRYTAHLHKEIVQKDYKNLK